MFENRRRGKQARNLTTNVPKILVLKSSSEQIFSRKLPLGAPGKCLKRNYLDHDCRNIASHVVPMVPFCRQIFLLIFSGMLVVSAKTFVRVNSLECIYILDRASKFFRSFDKYVSLLRM